VETGDGVSAGADDDVFREPTIDGRDKAIGRCSPLFQREAGYLPHGMYSRIRPSAGDCFDADSFDRRQCIFQLLLDADGIGLDLPTAIA
jgi:hypothetical protein